MESTEPKTPESPPNGVDVAQVRKSLGDLMRVAREARGISLDSLSISTKIKREYVVGLEDGDFTALPNRVFARGFIRTLGRTVGLGEAELGDLLDRCWEPEEPTDLQVKTTSQVRAKAPKAREASTVKMTQMAGLAAIISIGVVAFVVAVLVFTNDRRQTSSVSTETAAVEHPVSVPAPVAAPVAVPEPVLQPEAAPVAVPEPVLQPEAVPEAVVESGAETPAETPTETPTETAAEEPTETAAETVSATAPAETAGNVLKLVATDKVKVKITVDDQPATAKDLEPGETSIEFKSSAQILVYDAGSVTVFFNGKELSPLGAKGRVRRLSFADSSQNSQTF